jgi:hypothetical protein
MGLHVARSIFLCANPILRSVNVLVFLTGVTGVLSLTKCDLHHQQLLKRCRGRFREHLLVAKGKLDDEFLSG